MPRFIIKLEGYYLEWSTIVDAPVTSGMSLAEFKKYIRDEYGREGIRELDQRLVRVESFGTSLYTPQTPQDAVLCNNAGPGESELTFDEIYKAYCLREPIRDGWLVPWYESKS